MNTPTIGIAAGTTVLSLRTKHLKCLPPGNLTSMFQTHSTVIRAERSIGFEKLRETAVAAISGAQVGAQS